VDAGIWNQVCLELIQVHVQRAIESQRRSDAADDLGDQSVQVLKGWTWDIKVSTANIVHSFVVNQEGAVRVLDRGVSRENSVVRLYNCGGDAGTGVDREFELGFLAIVRGEALKEERTKA
jgi:hypothetical protein